MFDKNKLILVSNRLPVTIKKRGSNFIFKKSVGGLTTGLNSFYKKRNSQWLGWCGLPFKKISEKNQLFIQKELKSKFSCSPVFLSQKQIDQYYYGFCNKTIWPLFHCFTQYAIYSRKLWQSYENVNREFCKALLKIVDPNDSIWIHDYQLMLLPKLIREKIPNARIGFFNHIPFPPFDIFRLLPWRQEILAGLLGADLIGFHTYSYVEHFLESVNSILGYEHNLGQIIEGTRIIKTDAFPMGINYKKFRNVSEKTSVIQEKNHIAKRFPKQKIILSIDRLDYTKGILKRLEAYQLFLKKNPHRQGKVTLILIAVPSRTKGEHYQELKKKLDERIGQINGSFGTIGWNPIWYLYRSLPFKKMAALYSISDIALVTPIRDGMNLISKEFIATQKEGEGILILSETAGASEELGEALIVNPNNKEEIASSIEKALTLPKEEKIIATHTMQKRLQRYNIITWAQDFLKGLKNIKEKQTGLAANRINPSIRKKIISNFKDSKKKLFLLDYDGTLTSFRKKPKKARPSIKVLNLLKDRSQKEKTDVVIVSGRKKILDENFGSLEIGLVAEHGAWIKKKNSDWKMIKPLENSWKEQARPFMELITDRTPGSFIEEKDFSLAWHYRGVDPDFAF